MTWLTQWWQLDVVDGHKGPLLLGFCAYVVTFLITRSITRLIRAGKGPFHNLSAGDVHLHHSTPGILLLIAGAFTALGAPAHTVWPYVAALAVGVGSSLVLDEFAMIFRLSDDYWTKQGQLSVNMVTLAAACIALAIVGFSPVSVPALSETAVTRRWIIAAGLLLHLLLVAVVGLKGKYATMLISMFIGPLAWFAACRLARPGSPWARWFYGDRRLRRATEREERFNRRWGGVRSGWDDFIGGAPTTRPGARPLSDRGR